MSSCKREGSVNAPKRQSQRSLESLGVHGGSRNTNTSHPGSHLDRKRRQEGLRTTLYASSTGFEDDVPKHVPKDYGSVQPSNEPVESSLNELMNNARPKKRPKLQAQRDRSSNSGDHTQRDDVGKILTQRASATQAPPPRTAPTAVIDLTLQDDEPPPDDEPPQEAIPRAFRHPASDGSVQKAPGSLKGHTAQPAAGFQGFATMPPVSNPVIHQVPSGTQPAPSTSRYVGFSPGIVTPAMPAASPPVPTGMPIAAYHWSYPGYPPVSHLPSPSQTLNRFPGHATGQAYSPPHGSPPRTQKPHARKVQKRASAERPLKQDFKNDQRSSSSDARATTCSCGQPVVDIQ